MADLQLCVFVGPWRDVLPKGMDKRHDFWLFGDNNYQIAFSLLKTHQDSNQPCE